MSYDPLPMPLERSRAQESRAAIERLYIVMRHLFNRGYYKPFGVSGAALRNALYTLSPEIYGSMTDSEKVELDGLVYVIDRLPKGIEECRSIRLTSVEGLGDSGFEVIVPPKRRRNCYRVDQEQMYIELTRGRSEIYDILTHLTFLYIEAEKIKVHALDEKGKKNREWEKLEQIVQSNNKVLDKDREIALVYLSTILGRTFEETEIAYERFNEGGDQNNGIFHVVYWLGRLAIEESQDQLSREISFSSALRERIGHHIYGDRWANGIKEYMRQQGLLERPLHIISANLHSVMNSLYAKPALHKKHTEGKTITEIATELSLSKSQSLRSSVNEYGLKNGMHFLPDHVLTNICVQLIDTNKLPLDKLPDEVKFDADYIKNEKPVLLVMDYSFGEQAFETMDELLKPYTFGEKEYKMDVRSISIMGKAGILSGGKGDIMIPTSHIFEGTADNYPLENDFEIEDLKDDSLKVFKGPMITVLGTSLQNKDILEYFATSSWGVIGLEMEGAHLQKAIQANAKIRSHIDPNVKVRYAYYASDNPLITGSTLSSGSLGMVGVKPTYIITLQILSKVLNGE